MSLFNNPFTRVCTSGLGTGTDAGKALGYTLLIIGFGFVAVYYAGKGVYKLVKFASKPKKVAIEQNNGSVLSNEQNHGTTSDSDKNSHI